MKEFDENKAVEAIRKRVPAVTRDKALTIIDAIFDFYEMKGLLDIDIPGEDADIEMFLPDEEVEFDSREIADFVCDEFDDNDLSFDQVLAAVEAELEYEQSLEE